eukprot:NODE_329_length_10886_cov_0.296653.p6 type:complete len:117 gc:universal NODE_329_length_10886_cov_0.296653:7393-7743(+)
MVDLTGSWARSGSSSVTQTSFTYTLPFIVSILSIFFLFFMESEIGLLLVAPNTSVKFLGVYIKCSCSGNFSQGSSFAAISSSLNSSTCISSSENKTLFSLWFSSSSSEELITNVFF